MYLFFLCWHKRGIIKSEKPERLQCVACVIVAGVIYLKNLITSNWADKETDNGSLDFNIHEQDRAMIRDAIVDAVVHAPELIRQVANPICIVDPSISIICYFSNIVRIVRLEYN